MRHILITTVSEILENRGFHTPKEEVKADFNAVVCKCAYNVTCRTSQEVYEKITKFWREEE